LDLKLRKFVSVVADIDECASNLCENGGTCVDGVNSLSCEFVAGFIGETCGIGIDSSFVHRDA